MESQVAQAPGSLIAGRYHLVSRIGAGGMGSVWRARDKQRGIDVALKFLHRDLGSREEILSRFAREAELALRMHSRNIVKVLDRGVTEDNAPFIVYELLEGEDLSTHLDRVGRLSVQRTGELLLQVCRALERAHRVGVVHRDIKPANIFMCPEDDRVLVLDFGIAKFRTQKQINDRESVPPGSLTGTLEHMSPEHVLDGAPTDVRGDLYAVGVVGYRCLTGRVPFPADALGQLVVSLVRGPAPIPSTLLPGIHPAIDEFFLKALHRDPAHRFQTASEMASTIVSAFRAKLPASAS